MNNKHVPSDIATQQPACQLASAGPAPAQGPRILFFSGGTALRTVSKELSQFTHNTIHLITPFDSGGSSAELRRAFDMPAVGDVRSRIMALADSHRVGNDEIYTLFAYRLPLDASPRALKAELQELAEARHPLIRQILSPARGIIRDHLAWFNTHCPSDFNLAGASIGNLILTAGYITGKRRLSPVIALYSRLVRAKGIVRTITEAPAHLAVKLANGTTVIGQHRFTGKESGAITSPITDIWLTHSDTSASPCSLRIHQHTATRIRSADMICYPIGSFYSSVAANLLPQGVGSAIVQSTCRKVFTPNLGIDPELKGHTLQQQIEQLIALVKADSPGAQPRDIITTLMIDTQNGDYPGGIPTAWLQEHGITLHAANLVTSKSAPLADACLLANALYALSLSPIQR